MKRTAKPGLGQGLISN